MKFIFDEIFRLSISFWYERSKVCVWKIADCWQNENNVNEVVVPNQNTIKHAILWKRLWIIYVLFIMIIMLSFTKQLYFGKTLMFNEEWNTWGKFRSKIGKRQYLLCWKEIISYFLWSKWRRNLYPSNFLSNVWQRMLLDVKSVR